MTVLYKDLENDRHACVDKETVSTKSTRHVALGHPEETPQNYNLQPCKRNFIHRVISLITIGVMQ